MRRDEQFLLTLSRSVRPCDAFFLLHLDLDTWLRCLTLKYGCAVCVIYRFKGVDGQTGLMLISNSNNNMCLVFFLFFLAIAAMEDIGLHPKPTNDPPVHRPTVTETFGLHHIPPGELRYCGAV